MIGAVVALVALIALAVAATGAARPTGVKAGYSAALVSDIVGFNDNGFNKNQLKGLNSAIKKVGGTALPEVSHATSDYAPNFNAAIRGGAKLVIAAGFLLGSTVATYAKKFPNVQFA